MAECQRCKAADAVWAYQPELTDKKGRAAAYALGWHIRGFFVLKVCDKCLEELRCQETKKQSRGLTSTLPAVPNAEGVGV